MSIVLNVDSREMFYFLSGNGKLNTKNIPKDYSGIVNLRVKKRGEKLYYDKPTFKLGGDKIGHLINGLIIARIHYNNNEIGIIELFETPLKKKDGVKTYG